VDDYPVEPTTGLLDGDLLVFQCCAAAEYGIDPVEVDFNNLAKTIHAKILNIKRRLGVQNLTVFFSSPKNFRHILKPEYKINRDATWGTSDGHLHRSEAEAIVHQRSLGEPYELDHAPAGWRPYNLKNGIAYVKAYFHSIMVEGVEADDLLKVYQKPDGSTVIITQDKDLLQCMGSHYRWESGNQGEVKLFVKGAGSLYLTLKADTSTVKGQRAVVLARNKTPNFIHIESSVKNPKKEIKGHGPLWFLYQCLVGDPTDGIMGCGKRIKTYYRTGARAGMAKFQRDGVGAIEAYESLQNCTTYAQGLEVVIFKYKECFGVNWSSKLAVEGRCIFMVKEINDNKARMWHHDPAVREWYDLEAKKLISYTPVEGLNILSADL
jgi:5'-3' exonuclease